jgi:hypothetical protein
MEQLIQRCAGIDVGQAESMVCVRVPDAVTGAPAELIANYGTTTPDLLELVDWLRGLGVTDVAMESTGVYWKPIYYLLEDDFTVLLVNAAHIKHVPGRKTDLLTELPGPDSRVGVRLPIGVATFPAHEQRRGWVAGVVRVGRAAGRVARGDRGPV